MYSYEQRLTAVKLYITYNRRATTVKRELGYPESIHSIINWYKEYQANGSLHDGYDSEAKYSEEQKEDAVRYYLEHGRCLSSTCKELGYPCRKRLSKWVKERCPDESHCHSSKPRIKYNLKEKGEAVVALCTRNSSAKSVAEELGASKAALYLWKKQLLDKDYVEIMPKKTNQRSTNENEDLLLKTERLQKECDQLEEKLHRMQLQYDVLQKAAEVIKKDQGITLDSLTNREKAIVIGALRSSYPLKELLSVTDMAKSSYCYQSAVLSASSKYTELEQKLSEIFEQSRGTYGYRRVYSVLQAQGEKVSEKVIRRLMKTNGLIVKSKKKRHYSSYQGEITPAVPNLLQRDFHSEKPNEKWLTDITEFSIPAGKVYLSPIIDCFDGLPVSWTIGTSPDANLVNTMLERAINTLKDSEHPIIHSDRGAHYRWPGWIQRMDESELIRSMSKKGCSPDNSACEGFFGRLKNEMFYVRKWNRVTIDQFIKELDDYINWYATDRIKLSLGGMSPVNYRKSLGLMV